MKQHKKLHEPLLDDLTKKGQDIHAKLVLNNILSFNIMASPGAGKTSIIHTTIKHLQKKYRLAVIEGDIVPIDVDFLQQTGVPVVLAQTGGSCHLDSIMIESALTKLHLDTIDILFVENVGNLICPANFYLGTDVNVVIASVPEGSDKPFKYPGMFQGADIVLLNKIDYAAQENFTIQEFTKGVHLVSPHAPIIQISCKTGIGIPAWIEWITHQKASF